MKKEESKDTRRLMKKKGVHYLTRKMIPNQRLDFTIVFGGIENYDVASFKS